MKSIKSNLYYFAVNIHNFVVNYIKYNPLVVNYIQYIISPPIFLPLLKLGKLVISDGNGVMKKLARESSSGLVVIEFTKIIKK
jgi:hypothetical protein